MKRTPCSCWIYWRHIICTAGWYPAVVTFILTAGLLLALISTSGCHMVELSVGFTPSNDAWNSSQIDLGLFFYYDENAISSINKYQEIFHGGCAQYQDIFQENIIDNDRTWKVGRVMALLALSSSFLGTLTGWLIVFTPVSIGWIWNGLLLPLTMLSFIAEGSKFLIFDMALCRSEVWFPSGVDSLPETAESCKLGESGYYGIAAGAMHLIGLLCVCLKTPVKRKLDPNFGVRYTSQSRDSESYLDVNEPSIQQEDDCSYDEEDAYIPPCTFEDEDIYISEPSPSEKGPGSTCDNSSTASPSRSRSGDVGFQSKETFNHSTIRVSQSRLTVLSKIEQVESSESNEIQLLGQLVSELDSSLGVTR